MTTKKKALYFFVGTSSFVEKDAAIFSELFELKTFNFNFGKKWKTPFQLIEQLLFILSNLTTCKFIIIQLAGYHSVLPIIFANLAGKKSIIIAAGTDCHSFPSIKYGNYSKRLLSLATKFSFKNCSFIIPKHQSLWMTEYNYDTNDFNKQGIKYFIPEITTEYAIVENGYDDTKFKKQELANRNSFITISGLLSRESQIKLKGIDLILEAAIQLPDSKFTIVGDTASHFLKDLPVNVQVVPPIPNNQLSTILSQHQFYLQLSMAEGFPNALCEAMLCECIPIGSNVFSIPDIIGETGFLLKERKSNLFVDLIKEINQKDLSTKGTDARNRIGTNFTVEKRKEKLLEIFNRL